MTKDGRVGSWADGSSSLSAGRRGFAGHVLKGASTTPLDLVTTPHAAFKTFMRLVSYCDLIARLRKSSI